MFFPKCSSSYLAFVNHNVVVMVTLLSWTPLFHQQRRQQSQVSRKLRSAVKMLCGLQSVSELHVGDEKQTGSNKFDMVIIIHLLQFSICYQFR